MKAMTSVDGLTYLTVMDMTIEGTGQMADMMRQMMSGMKITIKVTSISADAIGDDAVQGSRGLHRRQVARTCRSATIIGGMKHIACAALAAASLTVSLSAQTPPAQQPAQPPPPLPGLVTEVKNAYTAVQNNIVKSAEQFPADKLTWQPTPAVRSWARLIGHIIDDNNGACWLLAGDASGAGARRYGRQPGLPGQQTVEGRPA